MVPARIRASDAIGGGGRHDAQRLAGGAGAEEDCLVQLGRHRARHVAPDRGFQRIARLQQRLAADPQMDAEGLFRFQGLVGRGIGRRASNIGKLTADILDEEWEFFFGRSE